MMQDRAAQLPFADMRGAQRYTLLIRTAKLVCESGEFLCIVRDVSETGLKLRLFHALPADRRMALELANGEVYFIERVWEHDSHAGFRFSAPIDVQAFIAEVSPFPRRQVRLRIAASAAVTSDGHTHAATLRDISQEGARIEAISHFAVGERLKLKVEGMPVLFGKVCWRKNHEYGLSFEQFFTLEQLAQLVAELQLADFAAQPGQAVRSV